MDLYDYIGNANNQISKCEEAIVSLKQAKENLELGLSKLKKIEGIKSCEELKISIDNKIRRIDSKISEIKNNITNIKNRSKYLEKEQEFNLQNMENDNEI